MAQRFWSYSRRVFEAVLRKYSFEDTTKKTAKRSSQIDGFFYAGCLRSARIAAKRGVALQGMIRSVRFNVHRNPRQARVAEPAVPIPIIPSSGPARSSPAPIKPKGYWDLVVQQFRKNTIAVISVYVIGVLFLVAAWAYVLVNGKPLVWTQNGKTSYPLIQDFVAPEYNIDLIFNYLCVLTIIVPIMLGVRSLLQKTLKRGLVLKYFLLTALLLSASPFLDPLSGFRKYLLNRDPYLEWAESLDKAKGEGAVFTLIAQDPITPTRESLKAPDAKNWLGTDSQGRDVLARMLHGARISLSVGFVAEGIAVLLGIFFGALAGFYRGWVDILISRLIEVIICFPTFFLILVIIAYFETRSIFLIMVVIGLTTWPGIARLVRGEFLRLAELEYVQSARALGASSIRQMFRHILPNAMGPVLVAGAFGVAGAILTESALSYLGFGAPPPMPTWGEMISQGNANLEAAWWLIVFPGVSIFVTVTIYNLAGDGLRDAMDPKMRH